MSGPFMAKLIFGQKNIQVGRPGFQLPIAPSSGQARKTRPKLEKGKARSRDKVPARGLDHKDFQADGEGRRLEQSMWFAGF